MNRGVGVLSRGGVSAAAVSRRMRCKGASILFALRGSGDYCSGFCAVEQSEAMVNPVFYFEIPVTDMDRAVRFYATVFELELTRQTIDGYDMALFPRVDDAPGASGVLAAGDVYVPSKSGVVLYIDVPDIDSVLSRAAAHGGAVLYEKKDIGDAGFVAEIEDSEGNRIGLTSPNR